jgi:hypothetical protein
MVIIQPEKKAHANRTEAVAVLTVLDVSTKTISTKAYT